MTITAPERPPATPANAPSSTLTLRAAGRRWLFWMVAAAGAVLVSIAAALLYGGSAAGGPPLAADNAAEAGGMAVVEVLRSRGVDVTAAGTLAEARSAAAGTDATVLFYDPEAYLDQEQLAAMARLAPRTVVVEPRFRALQELAPEVAFGGVSEAASLRAGCALTAAVKAGTISPGGRTLTVIAAEEPGPATLTGCFPSDDDTFSLVQRVEDGRTLTLIPDPAVLSNGTVDTFGNAALALNLLGASDTLVWYLPTLADVPATGPPSLGELTPGWVTPSLLLLALVAVSAFVWRGRRFGPLVAENLPVTVRASETMEGRARLYARGDARLHALDALRIGTTARLAARLGLPGTAGLDEIVLAVAAVTSLPPEQVGSILVGAVPATDAELVAMSDRLRDLERRAIRQATHQPHGRMDP